MAFKIPSLEEMEIVHENMGTTRVTVAVRLTNAFVIDSYYSWTLWLTAPRYCLSGTSGAWLA